MKFWRFSIAKMPSKQYKRCHTKNTVNAKPVWFNAISPETTHCMERKFVMDDSNSLLKTTNEKIDEAINSTASNTTKTTTNATDFSNIIVEQMRKTLFWKSRHFDTARYFRRIDNCIGLPSIILATTILGFAFYAVGRNDTPMWAQIALASLSVGQGILVSIQLYLKPAYLCENHKNTAHELGKLQRKWELLNLRVQSGDDVSVNEIEALMAIQDDIGKFAEPFPASIIRKK